uniref:Putative secreted protein n=1 Tax=Anopheles marajoara TaxID=58244 RepID=A0A2M4CB98_9DIPT
MVSPPLLLLLMVGISLGMLSELCLVNELRILGQGVRWWRYRVCRRFVRIRSRRIRSPPVPDTPELARISGRIMGPVAWFGRP